MLGVNNNSKSGSFLPGINDDRKSSESQAAMKMFIEMDASQELGDKSNKIIMQHQDNQDMAM